MTITKKFDAQKGTQFVFSDLGTYKPGGDFNIYSEIKRKLVEDYHIPSYEIRFIQECKNEKAKKAMVDAMNRGDIRIIFGSTSMLGTGVNAQQRAVAVHHWTRPGDHRTWSSVMDELCARETLSPRSLRTTRLM